jgi:hypothetical protein
VLENGRFITSLVRYGSFDFLLGKINGPKARINHGRLAWLDSFGGLNSDLIVGLQLDKLESNLWVLVDSNSPSWPFGSSGVIVDNTDDQKGFLGLLEASTGRAITAYAGWGGVPTQGIATFKSLAYDSKTGHLYVTALFGGTVKLGEFADGEDIVLYGPLQQPGAIFVAKFYGDSISNTGAKFKTATAEARLKAGTKPNWFDLIWAKTFSFNGSPADISARADVADTAIGPKGDLYLLTAFSCKTYTFGTITLTNPGYSPAFADSWTAYALVKMDWKSTVLKATQSLVPQLPTLLGLAAFARPSIALDKVGHLYLFGAALPTYPFLSQNVPTYNATTVGTCGELSPDAITQESSNIFSAKYSTLDCVEEGVKCSMTKGCYNKNRNENLFFSNLKE